MSYTVSFNDNGTTTFFDVNGNRIDKPEEWDSKIAELTAAEPLRLLRIQRNQLLAETDWRATVDYPKDDQAEWLTYRQALRDITTQVPELDEQGNLVGITWPTPPETN